MPPFKASTPEGFNDPTALPKNNEQSLQWQGHNRFGWESHPMRYDSDIIMAMIPDSFSRLLTNRLRLGSFLMSTLEKEAQA